MTRKYILISFLTLFTPMAWADCGSGNPAEPDDCYEVFIDPAEDIDITRKFLNVNLYLRQGTAPVQHENIIFELDLDRLLVHYTFENNTTITELAFARDRLGNIVKFEINPADNRGINAGTGGSTIAEQIEETAPPTLGFSVIETCLINASGADNCYDRALDVVIDYIQMVRSSDTATTNELSALIDDLFYSMQTFSDSRCVLPAVNSAAPCIGPVPY